MNAETLKALRGSIAKWRAIESGKGIDRGANNCPLCELFYDKRCVGCLVRKKTRESKCRRTPYVEWLESQSRHRWFTSMMAETASQVSAARKFRLWLEALLPKKRK